MEFTLTLTNTYEYSAPKYGGYGYETRYIYTFKDEAGQVYVWKTSSFIGYNVPAVDGHGYMTDAKGRHWDFCHINPGDIVRVTATVSGHSEYKGTPQIVLSRVKVKERLFRAKTPEEIEAEKKAAKERKRGEQLASLRDGDILWEMPYRQYKDHYADCETLEGSYKKTVYDRAKITVIIREGRLVPSGTRGQHYSGYEFYFYVNGEKYRATYRAVCEENALKRLMKDNPDATDITPGKIYDYAFLNW